MHAATQRHTWPMLLAQGLLALLVGALLLTNTDASLRAFAPFLGAFWLFGGALDVVEGLTDRDDEGVWMWSVLGGLLGVLTAILWLGNTFLGGAATSVWLSSLIALTAIGSGAANIYWAWRMRAHIQGEGWEILWGATSIALGIWVGGAPFISSDVWILLAALCALVSGAGMVLWVTALWWQARAQARGRATDDKRFPRWVIVGATLVLAVVAGGVWMFGQLQLASAAPIGVRISDAAVRGQQNFQLHCAACHNANTKMKYGPGLAGLFDAGGPALPRGVNYGGKLSNGKDISEANVREWLRTGGQGQIGVMPPAALLMTEAEVSDVIEFLKVLKK